MEAHSRQPGSDRAADARRLARGGGDQPVGAGAWAVRDDDAQRHSRQDAQGGGAGGRTHRGGVLLPACGGHELRLPQAQAGAVRRDRRALRPRPYRRASGRRFAARPAGGGQRGRTPAAGAHRQGCTDPGGGRPAGEHAGVRRPGRGGRLPAHGGGMNLVRSLVFAVPQTALTIFFSSVALFSFPFSAHARYRLITGYNHTVIWLARWVLGIRYVVEGREHLPKQPAIILAKHQSAWETVAFLFLFPPVSPVIKQELLRVPFFGWAFRLLSPIAIDRGAGREALKQIVSQGKEKLAQGFWVLVFPEGTRVAPGEKGRYGIGGSWLAAETGAPIVPVAHNAGEVWPKNAFIKRPGTVTVRIGPAMPTEGKTAAELTRAVEACIETEMARLPPAAARQ